MAAERTLEAGGPPVAYRLNEVTVSVQRQYGHGQPMRRLSLTGKGQATLQLGDQLRHFDQADKALLIVLNGLYRSRFFELPAQLRQTATVFLKDDGTVATQVLKMADSGSTMVCFSVPSYEKCVRYDAQAPRDLDDLVQRLLADAEQRAQPAAPAAPAAPSK